MTNQNTELSHYLAKSQWIWLPKEDNLNQYGDFRVTFSLSTKENTRLYISADSQYAVYLNGVLIPASQYPDYPNYKVVDVLDVSRWVRSGENVLAIVGYHQGEDSSVYRLGNPGLLFALWRGDTLVTYSDETVFCRPSCSYESGEMERFSGQLSFSFRYRATGEDGWKESGYTLDAQWVPACVVAQELPLYPRPISMLQWGARKNAILKSQGVFWDGKEGLAGDRMQRAALSARHPWDWNLPSTPLTIPSKAGITLEDPQGDGLYLLIDLQEETAGLLTLDIDLPENCEILVGFGEHLDDLRVRTSVGGRQFAAVYHGKRGRQQFIHPFKRLGGRYLQLMIFAHRATIYDVGIQPTVYPVKYKPAFHCADALHNRIFEVSRRTLELCMHEHYEDCPWREQALYAMDSRNQMLCGYYVFEGVTYAQANLRLLALGQRPDGLLELCAPARVAITIPCFSLSFVTAVWENLLHGGSVEFAREMLPTLARIMAVFSGRVEDDGLLGRFVETPYWNFYEWSPGLDGGDIVRNYVVSPRKEAPLNAMYLLALEAMEKIYTFLGNDVAAQAQAAARARTAQAMQAFWNEEHGAFAAFIENGVQSHYDQLTQSLVLLAGVCNSEQEHQVIPKVMNQSGEVLPMTLSCKIFQYQALMKNPTVHGRWVMGDIARVWGKMLYAGATSFWETAVGADDFDHAGSLCHGWSAIPVYFYYRYLLGIAPGEAERDPVSCGVYEVTDEQ